MKSELAELRNFPANLNEVLYEPGEKGFFIDALYATLAVHCLQRRTGKSQQREFMQSYLERLVGPERSFAEQGHDDRILMEHACNIDMSAAQMAFDAFDKVLPPEEMLALLQGADPGELAD